MKTKLLVLIFLMSSTILLSQNHWQKTSFNGTKPIKESKINLPTHQTFQLNIENLKQSLSTSPKRDDARNQSNVIASFPNSDGVFERYKIFEAPVLSPELAAKYPNIKSYAGQGIDDPTSIIRFSISPMGFQSMAFSADRPATFIESLTEDNSFYSAFTRVEKTNYKDDYECQITEDMNRKFDINNSSSMRNADDGILRTYRLAVSTTGEYTAYHGGTKAQALAAINATMTRVNGIFEVDFNVTMILISNTDDVIYTNSGSDPYTSSGSYNGQLQSTLTSNIGESNYDIGHLFANASNNGNAGCIGCVCVNGSKGSGWTSASVPEGDFFDVDYVAHEMGHQFGANHTWTFNGNEGSNVQVEPGSGTTIMSYAGITGSNTDVEQNVTPNFHAVSIEQVTDYIKTTSCQTNTNTGNAVPTVNAGSNYTIPKGTAFVLDGSASDADTPSNALTYSWEQMDENNASSTIPSATATTGVAFRAYEPTSNTNRYFPRLETVKTGATSWKWEVVPNVARSLNFRLTVRDNVAGGGTNNSDDMVVTVNGTAGPFVLNSPNTNVSWNAGTTQTVTWSVAGTTGNGVNAANVDILLSTDGGDTYPISLASGVTNDGSHDIVVPNNQGSNNRIMVKGSNHIFFDISNTNFTISGQVVCNATVPTGLAATNLATTSASLNWSAVPGATYDLRYRVVGSSTWTTNAVTGNSTSLSGLTSLTDYEAQVRSKCTGGSNSAYSSSVNFSTTDVQLNYCASSGNLSYQTAVSRVIFGSIDNIDGPAKDVGYEDFTNLSTTVTQSSSENLTVYVNTDGNYRVDAFAWIDWNRDGDFTDSGEAYDLGNISNVANGALPTLSISIPSNAQVGNTRMRVSAKYNSNPSPCETGFDGEVEDYTVIVQANGPDVTAPVITLTGASTIDINVGDSYVDQGATATDNIDGNLTSSIVTTGSVDTNTAGVYQITYNVSDAAGNNAIPVIRTVNVNADTTAPVISLIGNSTINITVGDSYTDQGATATDNIDGNLTSSIVTTGSVDTNTAGVYQITYNVSDAAGNNATPVIRTVNVNEFVDNVAPVITLNGAATIDINLGDSYTDQGATATDNVDGNLTSSIVTTGTVNTNAVGTYQITYNVSDAAGNNATPVIRTVNVSDPNSGSTTLLHEGFFESGWDNWQDGGSDCARVSSSRSFEGSYSIRIRDNSGTSSALTSETFNLTSYDQVEFMFHFYPNSMENGEDFWLRYYNGSSWSTIETYASGTDFNNNTFYSATVTLDANNVNFASNSQFRIQCDASGNGDRVYIDQVTINGIIGTGRVTRSGNTITQLGTLSTDRSTFETEEDFMIYPIPAKDYLTIQLLDNPEGTYKIVNMLGQTVKAGTVSEGSINVSDLRLGLYIIEVNDGEEVMTRKFIKE